MRSTTAVAGWLLTCAVVLAGCGEETAVERDFVIDSRPETPVRMVDGEPFVSCGAGPPFPASALRDGVEGLVDVSEIVEALDELRADFGIDAPRQLQAAPTSEVEWKVLGSDRSDEPAAVIIWIGEWHPSRMSRGEYVVFERAGNEWWPNGWGGCSPEPVLADRTANWVEVVAPRGGLASDRSVIDVLVGERECTSGRDPRPFLHLPHVVERAHTVTVYWTSEAPKGEYQDCSGPAPVPATLRLDKPLGDRTLLDGSTWPPRPVKPLPPWI